MVSRRVPGLVVGVTGGMGSGKSLSTRILGRLHGVETLSADSVGHRLLVRPDIVSRVRAVFGDGVFTTTKVDRRKLARAAFVSRAALARLNRILHPAIRRALARWARDRRRKGTRLALVEVPLLFESRFEGLFDGVLSVSAPEKVRRSRAGRESYRKRSRFQWSQCRKDARADWVVRNGSTRRALRKALVAWASERMSTVP